VYTKLLRCGWGLDMMVTSQIWMRGDSGTGDDHYGGWCTLPAQPTTTTTRTKRHQKKVRYIQVLKYMHVLVGDTTHSQLSTVMRHERLPPNMYPSNTTSNTFSRQDRQEENHHRFLKHHTSLKRSFLFSVQFV